MVLQVFRVNDYFIDAYFKIIIAYAKKIFSYPKSFILTVYIISINQKQLDIGAKELISMPKSIYIGDEELFSSSKDL